MSKFVILIDPIEKLSIKKDGSILLAHTLKEMGQEVYLLFDDDLHYTTEDSITFKVYEFNSALEDDTFNIRRFSVLDERQETLVKGDYLLFRLDPPFDEKYLQTLWILQAYKKRGIKFINDPLSILKQNEKLIAFEQKESIETFVGKSLDGVEEFFELDALKDTEEFIVKPLNLFQGIGVQKIHRRSLRNDLIKWGETFTGHFILQPYIKEVEKGEVRSLFFDGEPIASILKVPEDGNYLANIAAGASYSLYVLQDKEYERAKVISDELLQVGGRLVAFDILGQKVNEANITCPGLFVELSNALGRNVAQLILQKFIEF